MIKSINTEFPPLIPPKGGLIFCSSGSFNCNPKIGPLIMGRLLSVSGRNILNGRVLAPPWGGWGEQPLLLNDFLLTTKTHKWLYEGPQWIFSKLLPGFCSIISFCLIKVFKTAGFAVSSTGFGKSPSQTMAIINDAETAFYRSVRSFIFQSVFSSSRKTFCTIRSE